VVMDNVCFLVEHIKLCVYMCYSMNSMRTVLCGSVVMWQWCCDKVKAATGEQVSAEELGGADLHCR